MIQEFIENCTKSDAKRDFGLTTPESIIRYDNIAYGSFGEANLLDIYRPKEVSGNLPVFVNVHGGGYVYGSKEVYQYYCMSLAQRGFAVININYRLAPDYPFPTALEDVNAAFGWVLLNHETYGLDVNQIFMVGDSAGAQITSQYATMVSNPEYAALFPFEVTKVTLKGVCLNCGMYDLQKFVQDDNSEIRLAYWGEDPSAHGDIIRIFDYIKKNYPPAYIMTSNMDFLKDCAKPLYEHLQTLGVQSEYKLYGDDLDKLYHVFHIDIKSNIANQCNEEECNFLRSLISNE
jgi:acetyl esterase/lipase